MSGKLDDPVDKFNDDLFIAVLSLMKTQGVKSFNYEVVNGIRVITIYVPMRGEE